MKKILNFEDKRILVMYIVVIIGLAMFSTYALISERESQNIFTDIIRVDEEAYGNTVFDSSNLDFRPILDKNMDVNSNNVIHIDFLVGGSSLNTDESITYDIALADLVLDCELVSPYLKWRLVKNEVVISEGSLDYRFDTIKDGRLVLTPIQQDLKAYSEDKSTYDKYDFYMWMSDSCQSEDVNECLNVEDQSNLFNKKLQGKVEVELYGDTKRELVRNPSDTLDTNTCVVGEGE